MLCDLLQSMQLASSLDTINRRHSITILIITLAIGFISALYLYNLDNFSLLYYGDSVSHLVRSREFVDSINPGLFEQMGTAWLPLPHLLLLPVTMIDLLFRTGFAGLAISLPSVAIASIFVYKIIKMHIRISYLPVIGALLYASNPNMIYMGITPMTEAPFMLFFVGAAYFFLRWLSGPQKSLELYHLQKEGKNSTTNLGLKAGHNRHVLSLIVCAIFISLATLCRYEGWILPVFLVSIVIATTLRTRYYHTNRYKIGIILLSTLSFSGIALWMAWNAYEYGDPLRFANAPYYSAASQALERSNRASLYLQPWNVVSLYTITSLAVYGPILIATAVLGYILQRYSGTNEDRKKRSNLYLFLAMPAFFTVISMLIGIGEMNQTRWFNSRFVILISPLIVSLVCVFLASLHRKIKYNHRYLVGIIFIFFAYQLLTPAFGVITFLSANYQFAGNRLFQIKTADALNSIYDGRGTIIIITGSSQHNKIMQASGIPLKQFDQILESNSHKDSFIKPWLHAKYFILGKRPDGSAKNVTQYWLDRESLLEKYFHTIYENKYYKLMVLAPFADSAIKALAPFIESESNAFSTSRSSYASIPLMPHISILGNNTYVVWQDNSTGNDDILIRKSADGGLTFGNITNLSNNNASSISPQVESFGNNTYVVWQDNSTGNDEIFIRKSADGGIKYTVKKNLSNNTGFSTSPDILVFGNNTYVVWQDNSTGNDDILIRKSANGGTTFSGKKNLSNNNGNSTSPQVDSFGNNTFVVWQDTSRSGNDEIFLRKNETGGTKFYDPVKIATLNRQ